MMTVLSIAVVVLLGFQAAVLAAALVHRRMVRRRPGVFRCVLRVTRPGVAGARPMPRARLRYTEWVNEVLVVYAGVALHPAVIVPASGVTGRVGRMSPAEESGVGEESAGLSVQLDDGRTVRLVARVSNVVLLVGPYAASALPPIVVGRSPTA